MSTAPFLNLTIETTLECNINQLSVNYFYQSTETQYAPLLYNSEGYGLEEKAQAQAKGWKP